MKYSLVLIAFLVFVSSADAATWCTTYTCFVSRTVALSSGCIFRCESTLAATIPLGDEEISRACAITETQQPYCPTRTESTSTSTSSGTTTSTQTNVLTNTETVLNTLTQQTAAQTEQAYQNAYTQFLADLNASETATTSTSNIQTNTIGEVPWRQLFRASTTRASTAQVTSSGQTAAVSTKPACTDVFTRNFRLGMSHEEVKLVQRFLNAQTDTVIIASGEQSKGKETTAFNALTVAAVKKFQQKYAGDILAPVNEPQPTGFWGPFTRKKANELVCLGTVKIESQ
jgi:hypothetical protein